MKKFSFSFLLLFFLFSVIQAQVSKKDNVKTNNVEITKDGNYVALTSTKTLFTDTITGKTYTDTKGVVYPVYKSKNEKLYVWKTSKKSGNMYKFYLKFE